MKRAAMRLVLAGVLSTLLAACGGSAAAPDTSPATTEFAPITTVFVPEALVAPRTSPPAKPPPTTVTTTTMPTPALFPGDLPIPVGNVGYYTGNPTLGFHLNISTASTFSELIRFFTDGIEGRPAWEMAVRNIGQGFVPGYEGLWAIYTASDHVVTQVTSSEYSGVIEIDQRHVNILLDPIAQPEDGVEPPGLPPVDELPRPDAVIQAVGYSSGTVKMAYAADADSFDSLIDALRQRGWIETVVTGYGAPDPGLAVGELAGWKVMIEEDAAGLLNMDFENLALSFP